MVAARRKRAYSSAARTNGVDPEAATQQTTSAGPTATRRMRCSAVAHVVLGAFDRTGQRRRPARDDRHHARRRHAERRHTLDRVQRPEAARRPGADVDQPAARRQPVGDQARGACRCHRRAACAARTAFASSPSISAAIASGAMVSSLAARGCSASVGSSASSDDVRGARGICLILRVVQTLDKSAEVALRPRP